MMDDRDGAREVRKPKAMRKTATRLRHRVDLPPEVRAVVTKDRRRASEAWTEAEALLVAEFAGFTPTAPWPGSTKAAWHGTCDAKGHECSTDLTHLLQGRGPCWTCGRIAAAESLKGRGLAAISRLIEDKGGRVLSTRFKNRKLHLTVQYGGCNHVVADIPPGNIRWEQGCGVCKGKVIQVGVNDLATVNPDLAAQMAVPFDPRIFSRGSTGRGTPDWDCSTCGHRWRASIPARTHKSGCPACSNKVVVVGWNELATTNSRLAREVVRPDPQTFTAGSHVEVTWACSKCTHEWTTVAYQRGPSGSGCPKCAEHGYNEGKPGCLYILSGVSSYTGELLFKVGIANESSLAARISNHERQGLTTMRALFHWDDGAVPVIAERGWKGARGMRRTLPRHLWASKGDLPDGFTEAVRIAESSLGCLAKFVTELVTRHGDGLSIRRLDGDWLTRDDRQAA